MYIIYSPNINTYKCIQLLKNNKYKNSNKIINILVDIEAKIYLSRIRKLKKYRIV
jgi:hypothetical protein